METEKFYIEEHNQSDKSFEFSNDHVSMQIDYDDVDHTEVDAAIQLIKTILDTHWDEKKFGLIRLSMLKNTWYANEDELQDEYEGDLEEYLRNNGIEMDKNK